MNPYAPPGDPAETPDPGEPGKKKKKKRGEYRAHLDGDVLVLSRDARLPSVCMKCGSHQEIIQRPVKFQWTPPWARYLAFCLIGLIAILVTTKRAELAIPLCPRDNARWTAARNATIAGVVLLLGSFFAVRASDDPSPYLPVVLVAVVAFVVLAIVFVRPRMLQVRKIDEQVIELKGCHPGAAQEIAEGSG
jgi:hypothetical protein